MDQQITISDVPQGELSSVRQDFESEGAYVETRPQDDGKYIVSAQFAFLHHEIQQRHSMIDRRMNLLTITQSLLVVAFTVANTQPTDNIGLAGGVLYLLLPLLGLVLSAESLIAVRLLVTMVCHCRAKRNDIASHGMAEFPPLIGRFIDQFGLRFVSLMPLFFVLFWAAILSYCMYQLVGTVLD